MMVERVYVDGEIDSIVTKLGFSFNVCTNKITTNPLFLLNTNEPPRFQDLTVLPVMHAFKCLRRLDFPVKELGQNVHLKRTPR